MSGPDDAYVAGPERPRVGNGVLALRAGSEIVPVRTPDAAAAAGYVRLTSHLLLEAKQRRFRTIGVISAHRGEGKTTTSLNLAACLGRAQGRIGRVLLVDGDVTTRALSRLLGREDEADGRPTVNGSRATPRLRLTDFVGLDLMTAPGAGDEHSVCSPDLWVRLLGSLTSRYAMLVVDCPSVLDRADGLVLPACVDELVLVVKAGLTTTKEVAATMRAVNRGFIGVVLNDRDRG